MPDTTLRQEVENNYDAELSAKLKATESFKYYMSMGGSLDPREAARSGWPEEVTQQFNSLLEAERANTGRRGFRDELNQGLNDAGLQTERTVEDGIGHTTVRGPQ